MLVGNRAPYRAKYTPTEIERTNWQRHRADFIAVAENALDVKDSVAFIRHRRWHRVRAALQHCTACAF